MQLHSLSEEHNKQGAMSPADYATLQKRIDAMVGQIGLCNTIRMLEGMMADSSLDVPQEEKYRLISEFIITQSIQVFDLKKEDFFTSKIREYRDARTACYHLLKVFTGKSYAKIGETFNQKKRNILYSYQKCEDMLSIPHIYQVFNDKYSTLEHRITQFIARLS